MHLHDSNPRLSMRDEQTDSRPVLFLSRVDWPVVFRVTARFIAALCVLVAGVVTRSYLNAYGWVAALQSFAQCLTVLCFFLVAMAADSHNVILLMAVLAVLATLAL